MPLCISIRIITLPIYQGSLPWYQSTGKESLEVQQTRRQHCSAVLEVQPSNDKQRNPT